MSAVFGDLIDRILPHLPLVGALLIGVAILAALRRIPVAEEDARHPHGGRYRRQISIVVASIAGIIAIIVVLPIGDDLRGQLLSLFGLVLTAIIALSSTTFVANAMSGMMLRSLDNFRAGDFIRVADHFGRVTERGLLHTEIQTEDRDVVTLPNLFLITQPVRVVLATGTLVSCDLSLGYDVPRTRATELLEQAASAADLEEPFVHITELGNFAVSYRVSGFLQDVRRMVSVRSALRAQVLDSLHDGGVEIVSPAFMNQRALDPAQPLIPAAAPTARTRGEVERSDDRAEEIMFDKAETAQRVAELYDQKQRLIAEVTALEAGSGGADAMDDRRRSLETALRRRQLDALDEVLAAAHEDRDGEADGADDARP
ncbi:MAG TPA: mechanosensitive ion channel domain-containing protein [Pseudomonadales bacterium]|nr:mechanosensitive ion channel domain-containing protein [Pseudomonadales bacterium]